MVLSGWELQRRYIYCLLFCLNSGKKIGTYTTATPPPPLNDDEKVDLIGAIEVDIETEEALAAASNALKFATVQLSEAHRAAGTITVPAPSAEQYTTLKKDLDSLSSKVQQDQTFAALSGFFGDAAQVINGLA